MANSPLGRRAGRMDAGPACGGSHLCDPPKTDGFCRDIPPTSALPTSFTVWIEDLARDSGGWRVTLPVNMPVTAGQHTYENLGDGLVGSGGNGIYGDLSVARDGQSGWTAFHLEGWPQFHGGGVWDWTAILKVSRAGAATASTVTRHYTITRTASGCPTNDARYLFAADDPPRACAFGIDLLALDFDGG